MKRRIVALLLITIMAVLSMGTAMAAEIPQTVNDSGGTLIIGEHALPFLKVDSNLPKVESGTIADGGDSVQPLENGVTRLTPMGLLMYAVVEYNGEPTIYGDDSLSFFSPAVSGMAYIRDSVTLAEQEAIKAGVRSLGFEPIGWYVVTGYTIDSYRPIRWNYYEWTASGQSALKGKSAVNGENAFEIVSYFTDNTPASYKIGVTGSVMYQSMVGGTTTTMPIELSVTLRSY